MKFGGLLTAVIILAALGGAAWWTKKHPTVDTKANTSASPKLISVDSKQVEGIQISKTGSDPIVLSKLADKWEITKPKPMPADQDTVDSMVNSLSTLNADRLIEEHPANLTDFGLASPVEEVDLTLKGGKTQKLLIGSDTPSGSNSYAKLDSDTKVYTLPSYSKTGFDKSLNDLRDKRLLTFNQDKVTAVSLTAKGPTVEFAKNAQGDWQITKPKPYRADGPQVDDLIRKLKDAKMDLPSGGVSAEDQKTAATQYGSGMKIGVATVTDNTGTQNIEVHKGKDNSYYAKSSIADSIYKVSGNDLGEGINKGLDDFRNKKVFDFGFNDPSKLEIDGKTYQKAGDKWTVGSAQFDSGSIQSVIDKLRDLAATKFADKIGGMRVVAVNVTSGTGGGDNNRLEKVTINKDGDTYGAQREGESTVYVLDAKNVEDLQKAISGIKPYQAPKTEKKK
jgi:hypothetical protein